MPQPALWPAALIPSTSAANARNETNTPAAYTKPRNRARAGSSLPCPTKLRIFKAITGSTHGITLRISPPTKAYINIFQSAGVDDIAELFGEDSTVPLEEPAPAPG